MLEQLTYQRNNIILEKHHNQEKTTHLEITHWENTLEKQQIKKKQTAKNNTKKNDILGNTTLRKKQLVRIQSIFENYYIRKNETLMKNSSLGKTIWKNKHTEKIKYFEK